MRDLVSLALLVSFIGVMPAANSQVLPSTQSLYQITSGSYIMVGGLWGILTSKLPDSGQTFVVVTTDRQSGRAEMTFLGEDQQTVFLTLTNGIISGDIMRFQYQTRHPYASVEELGTLDYTVTTVNGVLWIGGSIEFPPICCDIPYQYSHSKVSATAMPVVSIRVSEVEFSWSSGSNQNYQVQYRSELTTNMWVNLGPPVGGTGSSHSIFDKVAVGQPRRFYRVLILP